MLEESSQAGCLQSSYMLWEHNRKAAVSENLYLFFWSEFYLVTLTLFMSVLLLLGVYLPRNKVEQEIYMLFKKYHIYVILFRWQIQADTSSISEPSGTMQAKAAGRHRCVCRIEVRNFPVNVLQQLIWCVTEPFHSCDAFFLFFIFPRCEPPSNDAKDTDVICLWMAFHLKFPALLFIVLSFVCSVLKVACSFLSSPWLKCAAAGTRWAWSRGPALTWWLSSSVPPTRLHSTALRASWDKALKTQWGRQKLQHDITDVTSNHYGLIICSDKLMFPWVNAVTRCFFRSSWFS